MQKIILYYKFVPVADPEAVRLWQKALAERLQLRGRVLVSAKGINGTLGGDIDKLKAYIKETKQFSAFKGTEFKWSDGGGDDFPKLSVKVRDETVTLGMPDGVAVNEHGIMDGGRRIMPADLDAFMAEHPDAVLLDGRNNYESAIGKFKNAITPNVRTFKELPGELDKPQYQEFKDRPVVTYCTGGVRCEPLSALMKQKGFKDVYQLHGGIVKYGEAKKDDGLWEGKCFVFDNRMHVAFSDKSQDIGVCIHCQSATSNYENCANNACNNLVLMCQDCRAQTGVCSDACQKVAAAAI